MVTWSSLRETLRAGRLLAVAVVGACCAHCDLPHGDSNLPDTGVDGLERKTILRLLAPPDARRIGAVIPVTVEATFPSEKARYCVRLAGAPGKLVFPFGDRCGEPPAYPKDQAGLGGERAAGGETGESGAGAGDTLNEADSDLRVTQSCIAPTATTKDGNTVQITGTLHAAYFAGTEELTATLFGALYGNAQCLGEPLTSTAVLVDLHDPSRNGMAESGGDGTGGGLNVAGSAPSDAGTSGTATGGGAGTDAGGSAGSGGAAGEAPVAGAGGA